MISRPKARDQFLFLVHKAKQDSSSRTKNLALTLLWPLTNKIPGTQYHHKLIFYLSCHVPRRVLGGATKVEPGTIRVDGERLLAITGDLIAATVTQRASICHYRWYLFLLHWIIWSSIHLSCPWFVNSHPGLHIAVLMIMNALIAITLTRWYSVPDILFINCHHKVRANFLCDYCSPVSIYVPGIIIGYELLV